MDQRTTIYALASALLVTLLALPLIIAVGLLRQMHLRLADSHARDLASMRDEAWKNRTLGEETRRSLRDVSRAFDDYRDQEAERRAEQRGKRMVISGTSAVVWAIVTAVAGSVLTILVTQAIGL